MATVASLILATPNRLRYLLTFSGAGATLTMTTTGAATPDILTDSLQGPIKKLAKAFTDGFGTFAAGAMTQAKSRAMWLSDYIGAQPAISGNLLLTTAVCKLTPQAGTDSGGWTVDADVDGSGHPTLTIQKASIVGVASTLFLDIEVPQAIGL